MVLILGRRRQFVEMSLSGRDPGIHEKGRLHFSRASSLALGFGDALSPKTIAASQPGEAVKIFWRPAPFGTGRVCGRLRCSAGRAEWRGDFVEPRVELDCLRQFFDAEINGALADAVLVGVAVNPCQCAWLADGEHDAVKLALWFGNHGGDGAKGITAGGVFIRADVSGVGQVTSADAIRAGVVVVFLVNRQVGHVALLLFAKHEAQNRMGDLLLIKLRLVGLVEISGGLAKLLVREIIKRLVNGGGAGA